MSNDFNSNDTEYQRRLDAVKAPNLVDLMKAAQKKVVETLGGGSPLDRPRGSGTVMPTRTSNHIEDREQSFRKGLHQTSTLRGGAAGVYHKDPATGRVRPSRSDDDPATLFEMK